MSALKESEHLKIPLKDIELATNNFETCIGKGGFGRVYRGKLLISGNLTVVAVKRLYEQFGQGSKEFLTEIALLSGQKHPNLISLLGYCEEGKEKIIVYEFVERGSLDQYLIHGNATNNHILTWPVKLKICVGMARGLEHLHNHIGKHQTIIHRDIKSANILVDQNWVAKITDLGLSKLSLSGLNRSANISLTCGTPGYCEPEYISTGIVKKESDVYSFGVVLLEILCGRLCTVSDDRGLFLLDYYKNKKLEEIIDPSLRAKTKTSSYSIDKFLAIARGCLHEDREQRLPMDLVVRELEGTLKIEIGEDRTYADIVEAEEGEKEVRQLVENGELMSINNNNKKLTETLKTIWDNYSSLETHVKSLMQDKQLSESNPKKRKLPNRSLNMTVVRKVSVRIDPSDKTLVVQDGYRWRKYGQKVTRDNPNPNPCAYYKCSFAPTCPVKKKVQRSADDASVLVVTYDGEHNHESTFQEAAYARPNERNIITGERSLYEELMLKKMAIFLEKDSDFTAQLATDISTKYPDVDLFKGR